MNKKIAKIAIGLIILAQSFNLSIFQSSTAFAASSSSTFTTSLTTTGVSSPPPSIPANLAATPASDTQIDLSWDASASGGTYAVAGYRLFRDGSFLATTSATAYSDSGLTASTTYAYTVEAFDDNLQFSGQSATSSATTLQTPPSPSPSPSPSANPGGGSGGSSGSSGSAMSQLQISAVNVAPDLGTAIVSFETNMPAQAKIYWGKTSDYEAGSLSALLYGTDHELQLSGLAPGTSYMLNIEAVDSFGRTVSATALFTTLSPAPAYALANPSNFKAAPQTDKVALSWTNPDDPRFDSVRIVRSATFFPKDQNDGVPVYEGAGQSFADSDVTVGTTYYYAIFAKAADGSFSSGALTKARIAPAGEIVIPATSADPFAGIPQSQNVDPMIKALTLNDFEFIQEGKVLSQVNGTVVAVNGSEDLVIRLKYEKVPEVLKSIAITLTDPVDHSKAFPFLLRINADKTYYEATIAPLGRSGSYAMSIVILDYQNQGLKRLNGSLQALAFAALPAIPAGIRAGFDPMGFLVMFLLMLLLFLLLLMLRRRVRTRAEGRPEHPTPMPVPVDLPTE